MKVMTMGLDMYAFKTKEPIAPVNFDVVDAEQFHYWRKHPNLHGWMEALYRKKCGKEECFNTVCVELTLEDLDRLEVVVRQNALPRTTGFFFGVSDGSEVADDLAFISDARGAINLGYSVFYSSWWWPEGQRKLPSPFCRL